jgi:beta-lactamase regulating signal transducer with metallopeptidase domain/protocatechuate 3,4-dioxygenase beta subunit
VALGGWQAIVDAPVWVALVLKITAVLLAAWLAHLALKRTNPRWRVFLWRVTAVGLTALPAIAWLLPALKIHVRQPPPVEAAAVTTASKAPPADGTAAARVPSGLPKDLSEGQPATLSPPLGSGAGGEGGSETGQLENVPPRTALAPAPSAQQSKTGRQTQPLLTAANAQSSPLAVWLGGIAVLTLRLCVGHYRMGRMVQSAEEPTPWVRGECLRVAEALGCRTRVRLLQSADVPSPVLCGLRRPLLLLPARMCDDSYCQDMPGILAHELTHVRSHDVLWNVALHSISIVLWFHPLAWRMRKAHLAACELVCDAVSASFVGDVAGYCRTLARIAVDACASLPAIGIAMARVSNVSRRLAALRKKVFSRPLRRRRVVGFGLVALLAVAALGALQFALAAPPPAEPAAGAEKAEPRPPEKQAKPAEDADSVPKTASLRVRVVDEAGKPLAGAKLTAAYLRHKADYTTDAEGKATVAAPGPNRLFLSLIAHADGYPPVRKWWRNESGTDLIPDEFTFNFERGRTIGWVVRNEQGQPIQGVKVRLAISSKKYEDSNMCLALWDSVFLTDAEGRWHLDHVPAKIDSMAAGLQHPDYISDRGLAEISAAEQRQVEDRTAVMVMKKGLPVSGTVTDPQGKPVAGAAVTAGDYSPNQPGVSTDPQGHYRFASLAPGGTVLTVTRPGLAPALRSIDVQAQMEPVDFHLEKGNTLRVRVVDKEGKPIRGVFVTPETWRGRRVLYGLGIGGRTDAEGRWAWTWAPDDAVQTDFGLTGYVNYMPIRRLPLAPQEAEHVVTLSPALAISGRVVDAQTKQPIPSFRVIQGARYEGSFENDVSWDRREMFEGKSGQYKLMITQPALAHLLRIEADGRQPAVSREFKDDEGSVTCDFALSKGKVLDVTVRLPDGKPAAGAEVCLCPEEAGKLYHMATFVKHGRFTHQDAPGMTVGPDGRLPIQPQDDGFLLIVVHDQGFAQTTSTELVAKPEITLTAWARLEGVVRRGTKPVAGAKLVVDVAGPFDARWAFLNFQDQAETDADGEFVFPKLKPGKWRVRRLPADQGTLAEKEKSVELAPGETVHLTLGGTGRPVIGRIEWPGGKQPEGDLSQIGVGIQPKLPEIPIAPKEVSDQGPEAARAWRKQWQASEEGRKWTEQAERHFAGAQHGVVDGNGSVRIEEVRPGEYSLNVEVRAKGETLPWEQLLYVRYACSFSVPEIPGGVSDEPLDLGVVKLREISRPEPPPAAVKPPPPQAAGEKTVGQLQDNPELLRYIAVTFKQNKEKIRTWQGKATIENRSLSQQGAVGQAYSATAAFVFDGPRKSVRWNTTLDTWTQIRDGQEEPQPVPQISNGMVTPEGFYRVASGGSSGWPVDPARRPLTMTIDAVGRDRFQPQLFDFNPLFYFGTSRGELPRELSRPVARAETDAERADRASATPLSVKSEDGHPTINVAPEPMRSKVTREGDQVTIDSSLAELSLSVRYTISLKHGCNVTGSDEVRPGSSREQHWTYELRDGIWLPNNWSETVRRKDSPDNQRTVTFVENFVNRPVEPGAFSLPRLGLQRGDKVQDKRTQPADVPRGAMPWNEYQYQGE